MARDRVLYIQRLREKRMKLCLSLHEAARLMGISANQIHKWERLEVLPSIRKLDRYARMLKQCEAGELSYKVSPQWETMKDGTDYEVMPYEAVYELRKERLKLGISSKEISLYLGRNKSYLSEIERGEVKMRPEIYECVKMFLSKQTPRYIPFSFVKGLQKRQKSLQISSRELSRRLGKSSHYWYSRETGKTPLSYREYKEVEAILNEYERMAIDSV